MALSIISNQAASIATRSLGQSNDAATATAEKLSSGKRINSAKDDAAGSAIAARLSAEVAGLKQAGVNAGQASSMLQIADGAFQNVEDILTRAKSLSVQAGSDQISDAERSFLDQEFQALKGEIDRIATDTEFNGTKLVNGEINAQQADNTSTITGFMTVDGGFDAINALDSITTAGVQGLGAGGLRIGTDAGLGRVEDMGSGGATLTAPVVVADFNATLQSNGMATIGITAAVMTNDGGTNNSAMFTAMITASNPAVNYDGATMATLNFNSGTNLELVATGTDFTGAPTIMLGSAFMLSATGAAASTSGDFVLQGQVDKEFNFKVGTGTTAAEDEIKVSIGGISTNALGIENASIGDKASADTASDLVSGAIDTLQAKRSEVGAAQNRLDFAGQNVELTRENQEAARSELEDLNVAKAITEFSQQQLLVQAGTSTLSQANSLPQNLLQLFR